MGLGRLATRLVIGGLFIGHGTQKLFGSFDGPGLAGTEQMMSALEMHPPRQHAMAAGITETAGGAALAAGLATPFASAGLIGVMTTAIRKVHLSNGPWAANGGYEYNLVLITVLAALAESGPGKLSLDALMGQEKSGLKWMLTALLLGVGTSTAVIEMGRRAAPAAPIAPSPTSVEAQATIDVAGDPVTAQS
jgi:putative oxidoreductase